MGSDHHANEDENPEKFKVWGATPAPNETHGDYGFFHFFEVASHTDMKDSAKMATAATADLIKAYDGSTKVPADQRVAVATKLFDALVYDKWLTLGGDAIAKKALNEDIIAKLPGVKTPYEEFLADKRSMVDKLKELGGKIDKPDAGCSAPGSIWEWKVGGEAKGRLETYGAGSTNDGSWQKNEKLRAACLKQSGIESSISPQGDTVGVFGDMPKFCWPASSCHDNTAQHIADGISTGAKWFGSALASFGTAIGNLAKEIYTVGKHAKHTPAPGKCLAESTTHGTNNGNGFSAHANQAASQYWVGVGTVLGVLDEKGDRAAALNKSWEQLKSSLVSQRSKSRIDNCEKVRSFFFKDSSKSAGVTNCRNSFDVHTAGLVAMLETSYALNMNKGLAPPKKMVTPAPPPPDLTLTVSAPKKEAPKPSPFLFLPMLHVPMVNLVGLSLAAKNQPNVKPLVESSNATRQQCVTAGSRGASCEIEHNARLRLLGQQTPQPRAAETEAQKAERFDAELQACLQSPLMAAAHGLAAPERCLSVYHGDLETAGIRSAAPVSPSLYRLQANEHGRRDVEPSWKRMSEGGQDVGFAPDGTVWIVGNRPAGGGFEIKRSNGSRDAFRTLPGGAVRVSAGGADEVWVVNDVGDLYRRNRAGWEPVAGLKAQDVAVGADGSVWAIGTQRSGGGFAIYEFDPTDKSWDKVDGGGVRIAVDASGDPWVVNDSNDIYERVENKWIRRPGSAKDIAVGADGSVWVIGTNRAGGGNGIWHWNPETKNWDNTKGGGGTNIAVGPMGLPCVVNDSRDLWCML